MPEHAAHDVMLKVRMTTDDRRLLRILAIHLGHSSDSAAVRHLVRAKAKEEGIA